MPSKYPVIETYKGVSIRQCNRITLKFGIPAYKKLIDEIELTGLSVHKLLAYSGKPCERCKDVRVVAYDKEDNPIKIKRGLLTIPESNGVNLIKRNKIQQIIDGKSLSTCQENKQAS